MSQNNENGSGNGNGNGPAKVGWGTKAGYIGTGVLVGLIIYPFVRKALGRVQPKIDELFDSLTGRAEDMAEKASDFLAKARDNLYKTESENAGRSHSDTVQ